MSPATRERPPWARLRRRTKVLVVGLGLAAVGLPGAAVLFEIAKHVLHHTAAAGGGG